MTNSTKVITFEVKETMCDAIGTLLKEGGSVTVRFHCNVETKKLIKSVLENFTDMLKLVLVADEEELVVYDVCLK